MDALVCTDVVKYFKRKKSLSRHEKHSLAQKLMHTLKREKELVKAVEHISFTIKRGQIYGILGPNGSGKSTLIRLISTLLLPDSGSIKVFGCDVVNDHFKVRQMINRVSVEAAFFKHLSSQENLVYAARLYGIPVKEAKLQAQKILNKLGFDINRMTESMEDLSRGMQQKVAVARALLTSPVLLLLDEPTTGLDPKSKREVQNFVDEMRHIHDTTVLLTTHDMEEAEKLCDKIAIIEKGKFVAEGTSAELKNLVSNTEGEVTLEDVFIDLTGRGLEEE